MADATEDGLVVAPPVVDDKDVVISNIRWSVQGEERIVVYYIV